VAPAPPPPQQQQQQQDRTGEEQFKLLLQAKGITPLQGVMEQLIEHYAASAAFVHDPDKAAKLYYTASRIPRSATNIVLRQQGIAVAQPFRGGDHSKAVLMHAFRDGSPMILKISVPDSIEHEISVMKDIIDGASENNLVVVEGVHFERTNIETSDESGAQCIPYTRVGAGLLMKHYQCTLAQWKKPVEEAVLLRYGHSLKRAIQHMHHKGYCHLDIKPSNIFLFEENCYLGDYGAARKIGQDIVECTRTYFPTDLPLLAAKKTDYLLLAKTLLEMHGTIASPVEDMSTEEIMAAIKGEKAESLREFLNACFDS
jgi:serine/threonine protein kinase